MKALKHYHSCNKSTSWTSGWEFDHANTPNRSLDVLKKVAWSDESRFLLHSGGNIYIYPYNVTIVVSLFDNSTGVVFADTRVTPLLVDPLNSSLPNFNKCDGFFYSPYVKVQTQMPLITILTHSWVSPFLPTNAGCNKSVTLNVWHF